MKQLLLQQWHWTRILRMLMAVVMVIEGIRMQDSLLAWAGGLLGVLTLLNLGNCMGGSCAIPQQRQSIKPNNNNYEEVV